MRSFGLKLRMMKHTHTVREVEEFGKWNNFHKESHSSLSLVDSFRVICPVAHWSHFHIFFMLESILTAFFQRHYSMLANSILAKHSLNIRSSCFSLTYRSSTNTNNLNREKTCLNHFDCNLVVVLNNYLFFWNSW